MAPTFGNLFSRKKPPVAARVETPSRLSIAKRDAERILEIEKERGGLISKTAEAEAEALFEKGWDRWEQALDVTTQKWVETRGKIEALLKSETLEIKMGDDGWYRVFKAVLEDHNGHPGLICRPGTGFASGGTLFGSASTRTVYFRSKAPDPDTYVYQGSIEREAFEQKFPNFASAQIWAKEASIVGDTTVKLDHAGEIASCDLEGGLNALIERVERLKSASASSGVRINEYLGGALF